MYVKKLKLKKIKGIDELEFSPGTLTILQGSNGAGKSSVICGITYLGEKAHNPDMIRGFRNGQEKGEISLEIGDETGEFDGAVFQCTITPEKTTRILRHPKLGKIGVAESKKWIDSVALMVSMDPIRILDAKREEQVKMFLETLHISVTADQLAFLPIETVKKLDLDRHALEVIGDEKGGLIGTIYESRKEKNALAKDKRATARTTESGLPQNPPEGSWSETFAQKSAELSKLRSDTSIRAAGIRSDAKAAEDAARQLHEANKSQLDKECADKATSLKEEARAQIRAIEAKLAQDVKAVESDTEIAISSSESRRDAAIQLAKDSEKAAMDAAKADYDPKNEALVKEIAMAETMIQQHANTKAARELVATLNKDAMEIEIQAEALTEQIEKLKKLKNDLIKSLPIPGLEISGGEILDGGIPLTEVNDAEKYRVVFEMGRLKMGKLGFMVMDNFEKFDQAHRDAILEAAAKANIQVLAAQRTEGPLSIETEGRVA
jgi:hypothetical protein